MGSPIEGGFAHELDPPLELEPAQILFEPAGALIIAGEGEDPRAQAKSGPAGARSQGDPP